MLVESLGGRARVEKTGGHPLLVGEFPGPKGSPTITLYNHLDVQPADREAEGWRTEPFRFTEQDGRYWGRGTTDDKGPALCALRAAEWVHQHELPIEVVLLWETEEEIGSPHFADILEAKRQLFTGDGVIVSDTFWPSATSKVCTKRRLPAKLNISPVCPILTKSRPIPTWSSIRRKNRFNKASRRSLTS